MGKEIEIKYLLKEDGKDFSTDYFHSLYHSLSKLERTARKKEYLSLKDIYLSALVIRLLKE